MTYIVSSGALNSTHSPSLTKPIQSYPWIDPIPNAELAGYRSETGTHFGAASRARNSGPSLNETRFTAKCPFKLRLCLFPPWCCFSCVLQRQRAAARGGWRNTRARTRNCVWTVDKKWSPSTAPTTDDWAAPCAPIRPRQTPTADSMPSALPKSGGCLFKSSPPSSELTVAPLSRCSVAPYNVTMS